MSNTPLLEKVMFAIVFIALGVSLACNAFTHTDYNGKISGHYTVDVPQENSPRYGYVVKDAYVKYYLSITNDGYAKQVQVSKDMYDTLRDGQEFKVER